jgi:hypothetical protein
MNSRELALVSTATVFGALASAFAFRIFLNPKKKQFPQTHNGVVSTKISPNPFDPSKRKESVWFCILFFNSTWIFHNVLYYTYYLLFVILFISDICHGMIILWQLHFYQLKDPKTLTGRSYILIFVYL